MPRTSNKAQLIVEYVNQFIQENGYSPSVREIGAAVGLRSTASVSYHLQALQEKGVTGMVFDLRNNAGGSPKAVQSMLDYVMPLGPYGTMTDVAGNITILSVSDGNLLGVPTVTLVNGTTAGEAEFFAAVLQNASLTTVVATPKIA